MEKLKEVFQSLFASIPCDWPSRGEISHYEGYYASVVYSFSASLGFVLIPEDTTNTGKIDLTILYHNKAIIIEFKVIESTKEGEGLKQIEEKRYCQKYIGQYQDIYLVGIEFSER